MNTSSSSLFDFFPYVYKSTDAVVFRTRSVDQTGWDAVFEPTHTSMEHSRRLLVEWVVDTVSILVSLILCIFLWNNKRLMVKYANSITFPTLASPILYCPFYVLSTWQTMFLLFGKSPMYSSILHCSLLRHFVLAFFQSAGLTTVPIAVHHVCLVLRKKPMGFSKMVVLQVVITFLELFFTLAHLAVGNVTINDVCAQWIASTDVFKISMSFNNTLKVLSVFVNFAMIVVQFCSKKTETFLWYSTILLLQSLTELLLSFPLTIRQWKVLLDGNQPANNPFSAYGYMFSFSCIFMVPLVGMICIKSFRDAFRNISTFFYLKK